MIHIHNFASHSGFWLEIQLTCFLLACLIWALPLQACQEIKTAQTADSFVWSVPWNVQRTRPGFPLLNEVQHFDILSVGNKESENKSGGEKPWIYHHHPHLCRFANRFMAIWSSHPTGEDGPGQKVLFASSLNAKDWTEACEIFPSIDVAESNEKQGNVLTANGFILTQKSLYALAEAHENTGFTTSSDDITAPPKSKVRTEEFSKRSRRGIGRLIRQIIPVKQGPPKFGPVFWLNSPRTPHHTLPKIAIANLDNTSDLKEIEQALQRPGNLPCWDFTGDSTEAIATDGSQLVEPTVTVTKEGWIRYWRAQRQTQKLYAQVSQDGVRWTTPTLTPIPDAPSKSIAFQLPNQKIAIIGNQVFNQRGTRRDPLTIAISENGRKFDSAYAIRWRAPRLHYPKKKYDGRGRGFQYPSACLRGNVVWVIYSVNKESIQISRFDLTQLFPNKTKSPPTTKPKSKTTSKAHPVHASGTSEYRYSPNH